MTMLVLATTDQIPGLEEEIERRRALGLDTYDEWWQGVYRVVTGPNYRHGRLIVKLSILLDPLVTAAGLGVAAPINVGVDKYDCRVPDIGIIRPDTPRTSPAFQSTAEMVVEIMSPGERRGEKLPFYAAKGVKEYLEIDPEAGTCRLLRNDGGTWLPVERSGVIELSLDDVAAMLASLDG